ncbi:sulfite exporter TauE/SafE family protein [Falsirhodobacter algicola]|uniref:Probable membrane transporter protein n=1 Tax=Falsirhodobacter algicola TaxID=2692330 RepID=A0A8J8MTN8_9RHOB|nr:sulfite exporter TauE/SafE family protein [Falsirhodobacter algicola]QUS36527.1 TSUP family transporter [Falsirhodobacter algicola]
MDQIVGLPQWAFWAAMGVTLASGVIKGAVGFAMPIVMISLFSTFLPPEYALAGLILPVLSTNIHQTLRDGPRPALEAGLGLWRFIVATVVFIFVSAPFAEDIPHVAFLLLLGVPLTAYALLQLSGRHLTIRPERANIAQWGLGAAAGLYGGVSGIWGPPLILYLLAMDYPKAMNMRMQGVVFLIGAVSLLCAHLGTGLMTGDRLLFSAVLIVPAFFGMLLGYRLQDSLDQQRFRWWTQVLLVLTGVNLIRQALM